MANLAQTTDICYNEMMKLVRELNLSADQFIDLSDGLGDIAIGLSTSPMLQPERTETHVRLPASAIKEAIGATGMIADFIHTPDPMTGDLSTQSAQLQMQHPNFGQSILRYSANSGGFWTTDISGRHRTITSLEAASLVLPNLSSPQTLKPLLDDPGDFQFEDFLRRLYLELGSQSSYSEKNLEYKLPKQTTNTHPNSAYDKSVSLWQSFADDKNINNGIAIDTLHHTDHGNIIKSLGYSAFTRPEKAAEGGGGTIILRSNTAPSDFLKNLMEAEVADQDRHFISLFGAMNAFRNHIRSANNSLLI